MPYSHLIAATVMTLGVCQGHSSIASFSILTSASRSPSAIAELLVNFGCPIRISGMAEARALKLSTKVWPNGWQITPKKGVVLLTWPIFCMHSCGVRTKSPLHSVIAINHVLDDGYWVSHPRRWTLVLHTLRLKLHRFDFSQCLLQTCLYNI